MTKSSLVLLPLLCILSAISSLAFASETPQTEAKKNIEGILERNPNVDPNKFLLEYYKESSKGGRVRIDNGFNLTKPIEMVDLASLDHPYLQRKIKLVEEEGLNALAADFEGTDFNKLRNDAIYNEAVKIGVQSALFKVLYKFNGTMVKLDDQFESLFDFSELMLANGHVKSPVILETSSFLVKEGAHKLRGADASYVLYAQAEVVLRPPSHRDYLTFDTIKPKTPETLLIPTTEEEREAWSNGVHEGWLLGLRQGNAIIKEGFASLLRDFVGMHRYDLMHKSGMISAPSIQRMSIGTNTNGKKMNVGESTFNISVLPEFNAKTQMWMALPRIEDFLNND
jgi:hypothetical protein